MLIVTTFVTFARFYPYTFIGCYWILCTTQIVQLPDYYFSELKRSLGWRALQKKR